MLELDILDDIRDNTALKYIFWNYELKAITPLITVPL